MLHICSGLWIYYCIDAICKRPPLTNGGIGKLALVRDQCEMSDKNSERDKKKKKDQLNKAGLSSSSS